MKKPQAELMIGKKVLVTTDTWFFAPDGKEYISVYGDLIGVFSDSEITGIKTNSKSTNWYIQVGSMIVAGCQIHYVVNCEDKDVELGEVETFLTHKGKYITSKRPSKIYHSKN